MSFLIDWILDHDTVPNNENMAFGMNRTPVIRSDA